jgi:hypothetical protein
VTLTVELHSENLRLQELTGNAQ